MTHFLLDYWKTIIHILWIHICCEAATIKDYVDTLGNNYLSPKPLILKIWTFSQENNFLWKKYSATCKHNLMIRRRMYEVYWGKDQNL